MTVRSAIYLAGNKYKLWPQIKPHLIDDNRDTFIDLFGGSATVSINIVNEGLYDNVIYNENAWFLFGLQDWLKSSDYVVGDIKTVDNMYSKDAAGYSAMRLDYNYEGCIHYPYLYNLQCRSNSNMMRFSNNGFNMTFGKRHRCDIERVKQHQDLIKNVELWNKDFGDAVEDILLLDNLDKTTVYLDPPYYGTTAQYNESDGWTENDNTSLLEYVVELHNKGAKVVMSNVFENRGVVHQQLIDWCDENKDKFEVHHLNMCYNNSSFRKGVGKTEEVLIVSKS